jgi:hypothetical protein
MCHHALCSPPGLKSGGSVSSRESFEKAPGTRASRMQSREEDDIFEEDEVDVASIGVSLDD